MLPGASRSRRSQGPILLILALDLNLRPSARVTLPWTMMRSFVSATEEADKDVHLGRYPEEHILVIDYRWGSMGSNAATATTGGPRRRF